jgi:hypothetical protein
MNASLLKLTTGDILFPDQGTEWKAANRDGHVEGWTTIKTEDEKGVVRQWRYFVPATSVSYAARLIKEEKG